MPEHLPEIMPAVIFDRRLGDRLESIDFDFTAFYDLAQQHAVDPSDIEECTIRFEPAEHRKLTDADARGVYTSEDRTVRIFVPVSRTVTTKNGKAHEEVNDGTGWDERNLAKGLNRDLLHEIGHFFEESVNPNGEAETAHDQFVEARRQQFEARTILATGETASIITHQPYMCGLFALGLIASSFYYFRHPALQVKKLDWKDLPWEKPAIAFHKEHKTTQLISISAKHREKFPATARTRLLTLLNRLS